MRNKYWISKDMERAKHRRFLRIGMKGACYTIAGLAAFYLFGIVGGLEADMMTIKEFIVHAVIALGVMAGFAEIGNRIWVI